MANHVSFYITSDDVSDFTESFKMHTYTRTWEHSSWQITEAIELEKQPFMAHVEKEFDKDGDLKNSYDWYCTNVGAKWCNIEEVEEHLIYGYSAWSAPIELLGNIAKHLKANLRMTFEDEFRNFVGVAWADEEGNTSYEEEEGDYFVDKLCEELGIEELPDNFEWHEEYEFSTIIPQEWMDDAVLTWFDEQ